MEADRECGPQAGVDQHAAGTIPLAPMASNMQSALIAWNQQPPVGVQSHASVRPPQARTQGGNVPRFAISVMASVAGQTIYGSWLMVNML